MDIQDILASNMKKYRKAIGLTQEGLAEKSGLHRTYIGGIEQKRINVSIKNVSRIAKALEVDPVLLFIQVGQKWESEKNDSLEYKQSNAYFHPGDTAFCFWTEDGMTLIPFRKGEMPLSSGILSTLMEKGYTGQALASQYENVQLKINCALNSTDKED